MVRTACVIAFGLSLFATSVRSQQPVHDSAAQERLGTVHFPTSCADTVSPGFDRAVALLHSFEFGASIRAFQGVLAADRTCAMAWWGIALSQWTNPMVPNIRPPELLARGRAAADSALRLSEYTSARERAWIAAVARLYADADPRSQRQRVDDYERAMAELVAAYPEDEEARIFHAIALVAAADPADKRYANQLRAGAVLEELFARRPDHPGLAHYIIHTYDVPALAARASRAARRYAEIAPSA
ncbi:MAG TPA: hypothetical protein VFG84_07320, partial [Gemmatimonadaceae bacterium]|nr:hypothetical protein [Gemmatimonadaceae bacterium]